MDLFAIQYAVNSHPERNLYRFTGSEVSIIFPAFSLPWAERKKMN